MPKILQLQPHIANLIAAGEVVERPASVAKELLENAVDAGASQITLEIRQGGMTFLRVTDNGCGMDEADAKTAFLRHATSKLRTAEDLAAISTMGFRGEALAAIASVSRIDLLTKTAGSIAGTSLSLEAGQLLEVSEAGCPDGTTIIVRDLFFNTPARMKFMKSDTVEGSRITATVQQQALAHPEVAFRLLRDGKEVLSTPGTGGLEAAVYSIYGRDFGNMVKVDSRWEGYSLSGFVCKPTDARPSRSMQTFFVNSRPVKSRLLMTALEEAYRNQIMVGKFPACVLHLRLPATAVDVNVHPAKTEVKFLQEKAVFDCIHYGVLGALNKTPDRPPVQLKAPVLDRPPVQPKASAPAKKQESFYRTMTAAEYRNFSAALQEAPKPKQEAAWGTIDAILAQIPLLREEDVPEEYIFDTPIQTPAPAEPGRVYHLAELMAEPEPEQQTLELPQPTPWRLVGELYSSYLLVEQGEEAFLIDKHAAHERILFEKLKANQEAISAQTLLTPIPCRLDPEGLSVLLENRSLLADMGFEIGQLGENTALLRQIPMDLGQAEAAETLEALAADLRSGYQQDPGTLRDELLHTVACKAAIKAGWQTSRQELEALAGQVMAREDLKHCPHGRPICITLSKKQLEKQFKRS